MSESSNAELAIFGPESEDSSIQCPHCGGALAESEIAEQVPVEGGELIRVRVPIVRCDDCDFQFTDARAEVARDAAVRVHRNLLFPHEIKEIRDNLGFTRQQFSDAFGIPSASMERWENGRILQNKSIDTLLRALANKGTASGLDRRRLALGNSPSGEGVFVFKALQRDSRAFVRAQAKQHNFRLRRKM